MNWDLRPYSEYKDSGVPWLGEVPAHWEINRAKWIFCSKKELNFNAFNKNVLSLTLRGVVNNDPSNPEGLVPKDYSTYQIFCKDDLVFKLIDLENIRTSRVGFVHEEGIMSSAYIRVFPRGMWKGNIRFFYYQFFDLYIRRVYNKLGDGVRATLGAKDLLDMLILIPLLQEQSAIVRFLDHIDRRIRRYIRAKKKLLALLNEQKQVIIQRAVTRGLDPDVRLKSSGVEWLGDIPEHWEVKRVFSLFQERKQHGSVELPILIVSLKTGVTIGEENDEKGRPRRLIEDRSTYKKAYHGDIAYNMMRMWQGAVGVVPVDGLVSPAYIVAKPLNGVNSQYFTFVFRTDACKTEINRNSRGIVSDRNRLYWSDFKALPLPVPKQDEQDRIVDFIEGETKRIDEGITSAYQEIDRMQEYRTRLIADAVTGKLNVREVAKNLPEEKDKPEIGEQDDLPNDNSEFDDLNEEGENEQ